MRSALCLTGIIGGVEGKGGRGKEVDFEACYRYYKKCIIDVNNCDVFIHSWSVERKDELIELYQPLLYMFEPQIDFSLAEAESLAPRKGGVWRAKSKWHSIKQVMQLKKLWEKLFEFRYDWIMISRFDLLILKKIQFQKLSSKHLHLPNLSYFPRHKKKKKEKTTGRVPPKNNLSLNKKWLHDFFFICNSKLADKLSNIKRKQYSANPHKMLWRDIQQTFGPPLKIVSFLGYRGYDFDLYRWRICYTKI